MREFTLRSAFNYDADELSQATGLTCEGPSRAKQEFKEETDINYMLEKFGVTVLAEGSSNIAEFMGEFETFDFMSAQNAIVAAKNSFMALPSSVRERFNNDPVSFADFASNPDNLNAMREMGLAPKPAPVAPEPSSEATPAPVEGQG